MYRLILRTLAESSLNVKYAHRVLSSRVESKWLSTQADEDSFGVGGKYAQLDSVKKIKHSERKRPSSHEQSADTFGTLSNELDTIEFKTSVSLKKPLSESKFLTRKQLEDEDDESEKKYDRVLDHIRLSNRDRPNTERFYGYKILTLSAEGKYKEAIDVFFLEMIEKDRFRPTLWLYKTLMRSLAHAGYTHMVFSLFKRLTSGKDDDWNSGHGRTKLHQIITILFHACSKSPWPEYGIKKCDTIRIYLKKRQITPNLKNYTAMINAYGKAGAIYESFNLVDEMIANNIRPNLDVFKNLLCSCISQPDYGFRYALMVWQMCLKFKLQPDLDMYNLMLRSANDCSLCLKKERVALPPPVQKTVKLESKMNVNLFPESSDEHKLYATDEEYESLRLKNELKAPTQVNVTPEGQTSPDLIQLDKSNVTIIDDLNIVGKSLEKQIKKLEWWQDIKTNVNRVELLESLSEFRPELKEIILSKNYDSLLTQVNSDIEKEIFDFVTTDDDTPYGRLSIIGDVQGVFKAMNAHHIKPDFKTFNIIIQMLPNTVEHEDELLDEIKKTRCKIDLDFINYLIRRRFMRNDKHAALDAFKMIQQNQLTPNIITFASLAYGVKDVKSLEQFLNDIEGFNMKPNGYVIEILSNGALRMNNFAFMKRLLEYVNERNLHVRKSFLSSFEQKLDHIKREIIKMENCDHLEEKERVKYEKMRRFYNSLSDFYPEWKTNVKIEPVRHPYEKFSRGQNDKFYNSFLRRTKTPNA